MVCFLFLFLTYTSLWCSYRMVLLDLFFVRHRMKGVLEWVSLLIQHRALREPSGCASTSGLLLGPIVNVTALRLHLFRFVLWLWLALPENKPVYCWALFCCGLGPFRGHCLILCSVVFR